MSTGRGGAGNFRSPSRDAAGPTTRDTTEDELILRSIDERQAGGVRPSHHIVPLSRANQITRDQLVFVWTRWCRKLSWKGLSLARPCVPSSY
jgi:hypothetical protein